MDALDPSTSLRMSAFGKHEQLLCSVPTAGAPVLMKVGVVGIPPFIPAAALHTWKP